MDDHDIFEISHPMLSCSLLYRKGHMSRMVTRQDSDENPVEYNVFVLHLKARNHPKFKFTSQWYGLWMTFKWPFTTSWPRSLAVV